MYDEYRMTMSVISIGEHRQIQLQMEKSKKYYASMVEKVQSFGLADFTYELVNNYTQRSIDLIITYNDKVSMVRFKHEVESHEEIQMIISVLQLLANMKGTKVENENIEEDLPF